MQRRRLCELCPTAFVTGASGGLGQAFCDMLLSEGVRVWGTARDSSRLEALTSYANFTPLALDLDAPDQALATFVAARQAAGGHFDLVVQNAGYGIFGPFATVDRTIWHRQLATMLLCTAQLSHEALASMLSQRRGTLVHVSSIAAEIPIPFMSGYNVAKAGLSALSESLLFETRQTNVKVIDFRPGDYRTAFNQAMQSGNPTDDPRIARVWARLEENIAAAPAPERAAGDLRRAILRGRRGIVRSGGFFQTRLAPAFAALAPASLLRSISARYFNAS